MTINDAKALPIIDYLARCGYKPQKISANHYWYHSPFRSEKTPSFKVNRKLNRWYDFGEGCGGNLVDLGIRLHNCSVSDFLQKLGDGFIPTKKAISIHLENENRIEIESIGPITSIALLSYLKERKIPLHIAEQYLSEVNYKIGDKTYYALGFKNDVGGYELRNQNFKGSCSPKGPTFVDKGAKDLAVFEGFFDFLSCCVMHDKLLVRPHNFLILNSASFFERCLPKMQIHNRVRLFLDNDKTGTKCVEYALSLDRKKFLEERRIYERYQDLNDWLINSSNTQSHRLRFGR
jgi:hypothetical protein